MALSQLYSAIAGDVITAARWNNEFGNIYANGTDVAFPATKSVSFGGFTVTLDLAGVSTLNSPSNAGFVLTVGSKSGTPSINGSLALVTASTFTDTATAAAGTATLWTGVTIRTPTLAASNIITTTDAATVYIEGPPSAGTNQTITNAWGLYVASGKTRLGGDVSIAGETTVVAKSLWTAKGAAIASDAGGTTNIWTTDGNLVHITGTNAITSLGTAPQAGAWKLVTFDGALTLTHGANLLLPGAVSITTAVNDTMLVVADTTTQLDVLYYTRASGLAVAPPTAVQGSSLVLIESKTLSVSNVFTDLGAVYDEHVFQFVNVIPGTNNQNLRFTVSTDNGSSFVASGYDYTNNGGATSAGNPYFIIFLNAGSDSSAGGICGELRLYTPHSAASFKRCFWRFIGGNNGNAVIKMDGGGFNAASLTAINAIKFEFDAGTNNGVIRHFGIRNS